MPFPLTVRCAILISHSIGSRHHVSGAIDRTQWAVIFIDIKAYWQNAKINASHTPPPPALSTTIRRAYRQTFIRLHSLLHMSKWALLPIIMTHLPHPSGFCTASLHLSTEALWPLPLSLLSSLDVSVPLYRNDATLIFSQKTETPRSFITANELEKKKTPRKRNNLRIEKGTAMNLMIFVLDV